MDGGRFTSVTAYEQKFCGPRPEGEEFWQLHRRDHAVTASAGRLATLAASLIVVVILL